VDWSSDMNNCGACARACGVNTQCSSGACACIGTMLSCRCGGWNFESPTYDLDGWAVGSWRGPTCAATYAGVVDFQGTKALQVDIAASAVCVGGGVSTPLCAGGVSINGWTLSLRVWFAPSNGSQPSLANAQLQAVETAGGIIGTYTGNFQTNQWLTVNMPITASAPTDALGIQLYPDMTGATPTWSGSMYLDDIRLH
jgi:hypothetical protein